MTVSMIQAD